jgi:hypothetical protein
MNEIAAVKPEALPIAAQPISEAGSMLNLIAAMATNPDVDVEKFRALMAMQKEIKDGEASLAFVRAMSACQGEMLSIVRDAENKHTRTRYARLETIDAAVRPIYTRHGFSLSFNSPEPIAGAMRITCDVSHSGGHTKQYQLEGALDGAGAKGASNKTDIQALGSTSTYLRRYLTMMVFNITLTDEDDDGEKRRLHQPPVYKEDRLDRLEAALDGQLMDETPLSPMDAALRHVGPNAQAKAHAHLTALDAAASGAELFKVIDANRKTTDWFKEKHPTISKLLSDAARAAQERIDAAEPAEAVA